MNPYEFIKGGFDSTPPKRVYTDEKTGQRFIVDINMDTFRVNRDIRKIVTQSWYTKHEQFLKIFNVQEAVILWVNNLTKLLPRVSTL